MKSKLGRNPFQNKKPRAKARKKAPQSIVAMLLKLGGHWILRLQNCARLKLKRASRDISAMPSAHR